MKRNFFPKKDRAKDSHLAAGPGELARGAKAPATKTPPEVSANPATMEPKELLVMSDENGLMWGSLDGPGVPPFPMMSHYKEGPQGPEYACLLCSLKTHLTSKMTEHCLEHLAKFAQIAKLVDSDTQLPPEQQRLREEWGAVKGENSREILLHFMKETLAKRANLKPQTSGHPSSEPLKSE